MSNNHTWQIERINNQLLVNWNDRRAIYTAAEFGSWVWDTFNSYLLLSADRIREDLDRKAKLDRLREICIKWNVWDDRWCRPKQPLCTPDVVAQIRHDFADDDFIDNLVKKENFLWCGLGTPATDDHHSL
jgi:hypothetical protein